jgi:hypothetical protein
MAKVSYAPEMYNRIEQYMTSEEPKKVSSGLLAPTKDNRMVQKDKQPINIVANAVAAIRKKKEALT